MTDLNYIIGHLYDIGKGLKYFQFTTSELRSEYKSNVGLMAELDYMEINFNNIKKFGQARERLISILNKIKREK